MLTAFAHVKYGCCRLLDGVVSSHPLKCTFLYGRKDVSFFYEFLWKVSLIVEENDRHSTLLPSEGRAILGRNSFSSKTLYQYENVFNGKEATINRALDGSTYPG